MLKAQTVKIDDRMAAAVLDRLGYQLQDLGLDYGDVVIPSGDISHQLYYSSVWSDANLVGYVNIENGIYYVKPQNNHRSAEEAALELLDRKMVEECARSIESERSSAKDYF